MMKSIINTTINNSHLNTCRNILQRKHNLKNIVNDTERTQQTQ